MTTKGWEGVGVEEMRKGGKGRSREKRCLNLFYQSLVHLVHSQLKGHFDLFERD